eukprot:SM001943S05347  [mRNA]  locus=s1943:41:1590:- [translate_table: standard]
MKSAGGDVLRKGNAGQSVCHPYTPGVEAAGVITELGAGVVTLQVGQRVAYIDPNRGAYCESRVLDASLAIPLPSDISCELAAAALLKGLTAWMLVMRVFPVTASHTVLVHAAAGGVGSLLCQWASAQGAVVLGTVGSQEKAVRAKLSGCSHVVIYTKVDFMEQVMEVTDGKGVSVVFDSVGKETVAMSLACLAPRGMLVGLSCVKQKDFAFRSSIYKYAAAATNRASYMHVELLCCYNT